MTKDNLEIIYFTLKIPLSKSITERRQKRNSRQEPRAGTTEECYLLACLVCVFMQLRTTYPGLAQATAGWALPYILLIQKISHRLAYWPIESLISQMILPCGNCGNKNKQKSPNGLRQSTALKYLFFSFFLFIFLIVSVQEIWTLMIVITVMIC